MAKGTDKKREAAKARAAKARADKAKGPAFADLANPERAAWWRTRADALEAFLREAAEGRRASYFVDFAQGRIYWRDDGGEPVAVASIRALCSYVPAERSVLMGWANPSFAPDETVPEVEGVPDDVDECDEASAARWSSLVASAVGAHYVLRVTSAGTWIFLGLWDLRAARAGEQLPAITAPWGHVIAVLEGLVAEQDGGSDIGALLENWGRTYAGDTLRRGTVYEAPLRALGERLRALVPASREERDAVLGDMLEALEERRAD